MQDFRDPKLIREALNLMNAKRIASGLPPLQSFGPQPEPPKPSLAEILAPLKACIPVTPKSTPPPQCSRTVKVWPRLSLALARQNYGGAVRAWMLAQTLDPAGSGVIDHDALINRLAALSHRSNYYRWVREAVSAHFLTPVRGSQRYLIAGLSKLCQIAGLSDPGGRVEMDSRLLCKSGWRGQLWAGEIALHPGPISRATLTKLTAVPARTQKLYDKDAGVTSTANYAVDVRADPSQLDGYKEFKKPHAFTVRIGSTTRIAYRLPNTYHAPETITGIGGRTRARAVAVSAISERCTDIRTPSGAGQRKLSGGGTSQRKYFAKAADVRKMVRFRLKHNQSVEGEIFTLLPGGIAKRNRWQSHEWWQVQ